MTIKILKRIPLYIIMVILCIIYITPLLSIFYASFKTEAELVRGGFWSIPSRVYIKNYIVAWNELNRYIVNTIIIAVPSSILSVLIASLASYALARIEIGKSFKPNEYLTALFVAGLAIPHIMCLIPLFRLMYTLGLVNTYLAQILTHIGFGMPICVFVLRNFFLTIPKELEDAARIDGCSELDIFLRIILPLSKPAIVTMICFQFIWIWNTLGWGLVLASDESVMPIAVGLLKYKGVYAILGWTQLCAGTIITSLPPIIIFILLQKYFYEAFIGITPTRR